METRTESPRSGASAFFGRDEIRALCARSDLRGAWAVASTWAVIAATFAVLARWPHPVTFVVALVVIAGRQLALSVLMHEASHSSLFRSRWANDVLVDWLCARPVWSDVRRYRAHHVAHHQRTGMDGDPDLSLVDRLPTTRASLARKLARDVLGVTGLRYLAGRFLMDAEVLRYTVAADVERLPPDGRTWRDHARALLRNAGPTAITNGLLFALLAASGHAGLYGVWVLAYVTPFPLFVRIRSLAEHACTERHPDPLRNTRTTRAGWLARATVAPFRVNYHLEHHLLPAVPYHRLADMHRLLAERAALPPDPRYLDVLALVSASRS